MSRFQIDLSELQKTYRIDTSSSLLETDKSSSGVVDRNWKLESSQALGRFEDDDLLEIAVAVLIRGALDADADADVDPMLINFRAGIHDR